MNEQDIQNALGKNVYSMDGAMVGNVGQAYFDDTTGRPEWVTVATGLFGGNENFVPVAHADLTDEGLDVPYDKDRIRSAPSIGADGGHLTPDKEAELYRHYDLEFAQDESPSGLAVQEPGSGGVPISKGRLRKYVVTETITMPVAHQ